MNANRPTPEDESRARPVALAIAFIAGVVATVLRIVPHPPGFSGVGSVGIFGGARLRGWQAFLLPVGIMVLSDLCLWVFTDFDAKYSLLHLSRLYVYPAFVMYVLIGRWLQNRNSIRSNAVAATLGALQFFIVTNFFVWLLQPYESYYDTIPEAFRYSRDLSGLATCYAYALPFYLDKPSVYHPFMLFEDHNFSLFWMWIGDFGFSTAYLVAYRVLTQRGVAAEPTPEVQS